MARPRTTLAATLCNCRSVTLAPARFQSTSAAPAPAHRVLAGALLSRPPLLLPPLTPLEASYHAYSRNLHRALSKPLSASLGWFFGAGKKSASEVSFTEYEQRVSQEKGDEAELEGFTKAGATVEGAAELVGRRSEEQDKNVKDLERKADRTLYLMLRKDRKEHSWAFPSTPLKQDESLLQASQRYLTETAGPNMDLWAVSRAPAGAVSYNYGKMYAKKAGGAAGARVFFLPMRIIRGSPSLSPSKKKDSASTPIAEFAWLTKEEIQERLGGEKSEYWKAVESMLSK